MAYLIENGLFFYVLLTIVILLVIVLVWVIITTRKEEKALKEFKTNNVDPSEIVKLVKITDLDKEEQDKIYDKADESVKELLNDEFLYDVKTSKKDVFDNINKEHFINDEIKDTKEKFNMDDFPNIDDIEVDEDITEKIEVDVINKANSYIESIMNNSDK